MIPKHSIISYIRNRKGKPVGVLVAVKNEQGYSVGYSLCCKRDRFCKEMGLRIALGRANGTAEPVPHPVRRALPEFTARCQRYYREKLPS